MIHIHLYLTQLSIHLPGLLPADALPDDALGLHAPRAVVEVREGRRQRGVERQQLLLTRLAMAPGELGNPPMAHGVE